MSRDRGPVFTPVERTAPDEVYACRLWFDGVALIHVYQTDTSSKPPAPNHLAKKNVVENQNNRIITLDESRSISGWTNNTDIPQSHGLGLII